MEQIHYCLRVLSGSWLSDKVFLKKNQYLGYNSGLNGDEWFDIQNFVTF